MADGHLRTRRIGRSIAGTIDYGAPEQLGRISGVPVCPSSDVYGLGRTLCYALFGTPNPGPDEWINIPDAGLRSLLAKCLKPDPRQRFQSISELLPGLADAAQSERTNIQDEFSEWTKTIRLVGSISASERTDILDEFWECSKTVRRRRSTSAFLEKRIMFRMRDWRAAAEGGMPEAQVLLGACFECGQGVARDYPEAMRWYQKAANQGLVDAMYIIGDLYSNGQGVAEDSAEAMRWYQKAADLGNKEAMYAIGEMYDSGSGVPEDYPKARDWYRKAADEGDVDAMVRLGILYGVGEEGVAEDSAESMRWWQKAADKGHAYAMYMIGIAYSSGQDVQHRRLRQGNTLVSKGSGLGQQGGDGIHRRDV